VPPAEHVPTTSTTVMDDPSPTPTTTNQDQGEATIEGEVASRREPPRRVQVEHKVLLSFQMHMSSNMLQSVENFNVQANILGNYVRDEDICTQVYYSFI
jgi:hypothetical protein